MSDIDPNDGATARAVALRVIGGAAQSAAGLQRRLERRGFSVRTAQEAVEAMEKLGYVNDEQLARSIAARRSAQGYGKAAIAHFLAARLIDKVVAERTLAQLDVDEEAIAQGVASKVGQRGDARKVAATLRRRGFQSSTIRRVLENTSAG